MARPRSTSPPKSAWPGVSTTLMVTASCGPSGVALRTAVFLARIVMPFSRSSSPESMHPVDELGTGGEGARLAQHGVDQRGLAVVDVRHDRHVAQVGARTRDRDRAGHGGRGHAKLLMGVRGGRPEEAWPPCWRGCSDRQVRHCPEYRLSGGCRWRIAQAGPVTMSAEDGRNAGGSGHYDWLRCVHIVGMWWAASRRP